MASFTRRSLLYSAAGLSTAFSLRAFSPGEVWNDKDPGSWSGKDIDKLLTHSPWAKEVTVEFGSAMRGSPGYGRGAGRSGRMGGGGMGAPGIGGGGMPGTGMGGGMGRGGGAGGGMPRDVGTIDETARRQESRVIVRWESAAPIRAAEKKPLPEGLTGNYVIGVTGLPIRPEANGGSPEDTMERLKESTRLEAKGKDAIAPSKIIDAPSGEMLFVFPEDPAIDAHVKEVTFQTRIGPAQVRAKFSPKDMMYRGQFAA